MKTKSSIFILFLVWDWLHPHYIYSPSIDKIERWSSWSPWQGWSWSETRRRRSDRPCSCPQSWQINHQVLILKVLYFYTGLHRGIQVDVWDLNISMISCSDTGSGRWVIMCLISIASDAWYPRYCTHLKSARVKNFSLILYFFARNLTLDIWMYNVLILTSFAMIMIEFEVANYMESLLTGWGSVPHRFWKMQDLNLMHREQKRVELRFKKKRMDVLVLVMHSTAVAASLQCSL